VDSDPGSPPQTSSSAISSSANFLYCDVRNQWAKCRFLRSKFCNNLDSFHLKYKASEPIRHKSYLSYSNHEYESCHETFTIELLVFQEVLLARLVSYNLIRKDRSIIPVQYAKNTRNHSTHIDLLTFALIDSLPTSSRTNLGYNLREPLNEACFAYKYCTV
jgi:hypothetical protein